MQHPSSRNSAAVTALSSCTQKLTTPELRMFCGTAIVTVAGCPTLVTPPLNGCWPVPGTDAPLWTSCTQSFADDGLPAPPGRSALTLTISVALVQTQHLPGSGSLNEWPKPWSGFVWFHMLPWAAVPSAPLKSAAFSEGGEGGGAVSVRVIGCGHATVGAAIRSCANSNPANSMVKMETMAMFFL